jgi:deoxyribose-phosphate aldolase
MVSTPKISAPAHAQAAHTTAPVTLDARSVAHMIDHTLLRPEATRDQVLVLCDEAAHHGFAAVCVNPSFVALAASRLAGTRVKVATVVGFPLGAMLTTVKRFEAAEALRLGARELDMVINIGALRSGDATFVESDIRAVAEVAHHSGALLKVIIESALLNDQQKMLACQLAANAGADFVKTSTGFASGGATAADVALMRAVVGPKIGVKASGGIRTAAQVQEMIAAGANRIGTSSGVAITAELQR